MGKKQHNREKVLINFAARAEDKDGLTPLHIVAGERGFQVYGLNADLTLFSVTITGIPRAFKSVAELQRNCTKPYERQGFWLIPPPEV